LPNATEHAAGYGTDATAFAFMHDALHRLYAAAIVAD
jgi:hypothetical protein